MQRYSECAIHTHKPTHYQLKKRHQNPLGIFKDLSIRRDRKGSDSVIHVVIVTATASATSRDGHHLPA
jgi:hypothetical protein